MRRHIELDSINRKKTPVGNPITPKTERGRDFEVTMVRGFVPGHVDGLTEQYNMASRLPKSVLTPLQNEQAKQQSDQRDLILFGDNLS